MESKIIKVIDEHSIDRDANTIFSVDIDGSEYIVYWINRDEENNNIFVSKLIKNLDGTSNMLNIDDTFEKSKISSIIKELIELSVNNENEMINDNQVSLPSGRIVKLCSAIVNREQNINVQKTYITTVMKSITKVATEYFKYQEKVIEQVVAKDEASSDIFLDIPTIDTSSNVNEPVVSPVVEIPSEINIISSGDEKPVFNENNFDTTKSVENIPSESITFNVPTSESLVMVDTTLPKEAINMTTPSIESVPNLIDIPSSEPVVSTVNNERVVPASVLPEVPKVVETPPIAPVVTADPVIPASVSVEFQPFGQPASTEPQLVFDGSKETNLNMALGEASNDTTIPVENIEPVREFGVDQSLPESQIVSNQSVNNELNNSAQQFVGSPKVSGGFVNSKFFMVIAITLFLASCVFLGYEAFQFFQTK